MLAEEMDPRGGDPGTLTMLTEAVGGLERVYQSAYKRYGYSGLLAGQSPFTPTATERLAWLRDMIANLQPLHAWQVDTGAFPKAIQTRREIGRLLDEMRLLLDEVGKESTDAIQPRDA